MSTFPVGEAIRVCDLKLGPLAEQSVVHLVSAHRAVLSLSAHAATGIDEPVITRAAFVSESHAKDIASSGDPRPVAARQRHGKRALYLGPPLLTPASRRTTAVLIRYAASLEAVPLSRA